MTDITNLNLREPDPIDWDNYDTGERKPIFLPPKGQYLFQVAEAPIAAATQEGYLKMQFPSLKIVKPGDPANDYDVKFTNVSAKKWAKREGSPLGDYLKSHGISGQRTNVEYIDACYATVGRASEAGADWRAYCKECGKEIKGMENFPVQADGSRQPWVDCDKCLDHTDPNNPRPKRLWANLQVTFFRARK